MEFCIDDTIWEISSCDDDGLGGDDRCGDDGVLSTIVDCCGDDGTCDGDSIGAMVVNLVGV